MIPHAKLKGKKEPFRKENVLLNIFRVENLKENLHAHFGEERMEWPAAWLEKYSNFVGNKLL